MKQKKWSWGQKRVLWFRGTWWLEPWSKAVNVCINYLDSVQNKIFFVKIKSSQTLAVNQDYFGVKLYAVKAVCQQSKQ